VDWIDEHPVEFSGLRKARELVQLMTTNIVNERMDENSCVAISTEIDYLLVALRGLSEANSDRLLVEELAEFLEEQQ
jgi:hypothetical protein